MYMDRCYESSQHLQDQPKYNVGTLGDQRLHHQMAYIEIYLCHLNTLHQRPTWDCIVYKSLLVGTCMNARQLTRESFDRNKVARKW